MKLGYVPFKLDGIADGNILGYLGKALAATDATTLRQNGEYVLAFLKIGSVRYCSKAHGQSKTSDRHPRARLRGIAADYFADKGINVRRRTDRVIAYDFVIAPDKPEEIVLTTQVAADIIDRLSDFAECNNCLVVAGAHMVEQHGKGVSNPHVHVLVGPDVKAEALVDMFDEFIDARECVI